VSRATTRTVLTDPVHFLAFGFGAGLAPVAPGTWGTLVAVPIWVGLAELDIPLRVAAVVAVCLAGFWLCGESARRLGEHDHPGIVWDEIAGYLLAMLAAPAGWIWIVTGFCLFRLFDIWKPWPIRELDRGLSGGIGIMMDDLVAGVFAAAVMLVARYWTGV